MHLEQLNLTYLPQEDRILLRIGFFVKDADPEKQEVQIFFTRRMLQRMWPTLMEAIGSHMRLNRPETAFASDELVNLEHKKAVDTIKEKGNFSQAYDADKRKSMNGERPLLLETIKFHLKPDAPLWLQFITPENGSIDLKLETSLIHGFCKLLIDAERASGWGLELSLPKVDEIGVPPHLLN
ncbi:hypothetical protein [Undibacterium fentianense]|uniref:Uncharacterized protein n=1 Tax=Undibacterium fentianense TaxID=2828728 RepID=A0A941E586_9BURK|nr:hypothetical protein [Undibacterium fentianense]MBR7801297.1 hypothetical protein [Undibacterium fentianense]